MKSNKYKEAYKDEWAKGNAREEAVKSLFEDEGFSVTFNGFAAGSDEFVEGDSTEHGHEHGEPDLAIESDDVLVEVTGTDSPNVSVDDDLWIRPDKLQYAVDHPKQDVWLFHVLDRLGCIRGIKLDPERCDKWLDEQARKVETWTRAGVYETFWAVESHEDCVKQLSGAVQDVCVCVDDHLLSK